MIYNILFVVHVSITTQVLLLILCKVQVQQCYVEQLIFSRHKLIAWPYCCVNCKDYSWSPQKKKISHVDYVIKEVVRLGNHVVTGHNYVDMHDLLS